MAKARVIEFHEKLSDVTECSICADIFSNPKILPCVHTFCLHCLDTYGKDKKHGEKMACPICRNEFVIPDGGLSELPNNFFIGKIVEIWKLATAPTEGEVCDLCFEETAFAKKFCIDCEQKLCDRCSKSHTRIQHCQNHQVVELGSQLNAQEFNLRNSYCEHHPKDLIKMFCHEDNVAICLICCVESHQSHKCSNVEKVAGQFAEQLKDDFSKVASRRPECEEAFQKLEKLKTEFTEEVLKTEEDIRKSGYDLKKLIDQHIEELTQNLRVVRDRNLKCFETTKQDVARFRVMIDSYQRYCNELLAKGSPVDICRAANQMHTRATELEKLPANCSVDDFKCDKIAFHCTNAEILTKDHRTNNVVGELTVTKSSDRIVKFQKRISENDVPANWETMTNDDEFKTIQLNIIDQEFKDVAKALLSTTQTTVIEIVKIERIQNKRIYKQYVVRKTAMEAENPGVQNEMTLWYATGADTLESINRSGFDQRNCWQRMDFGTGIYFAKNVSDSAQNTYHSPDGSVFKCVFQCKVLTGKYVLGNRGITVPPPKPGNTGLKYDATVDNVANPTTFVIYCGNQAYPAYLIHFK